MINNRICMCDFSEAVISMDIYGLFFLSVKNLLGNFSI